MKVPNYKNLLAFLLIIMASCNEPETIVTDIVNRDGSVIRKIEIRNKEKKFKFSDAQVPIDSTWNLKDTLEINSKGDTVWINRGEKHFVSTEELSRSYLSDSSSNKGISRHITFSKKFRWFNTKIRFSEIIDRKITHGYPVSDFLNSDELQWFYLPDNLKNERRNSSDSLKFKALNDSVEKKGEKWIYRNLVSEWIYEFAGFIKEKAGASLTEEAMRKNENLFVRALGSDLEKADSLWENGTLLKQLIGEENAWKFRAEADSAVKITAGKIWFDFNEYTVRTVMPGRLTATNGLIDSAGAASWLVKSDFFLAQDYEMWAESKIQNGWAWITTGIFILFVFSGIILLKMRKG